MVFVGYGSISFNALSKTALQLSSAPAMRGRVMALWAVAWQDSTPIGGPIVGLAGQELGARWALIIGGVPTLVVGLATLPFWRRSTGERAERLLRSAGADPALNS